MKRLAVLCTAMLLLLGSASPPPLADAEIAAAAPVTARLAQAAFAHSAPQLARPAPAAAPAPARRAEPRPAAAGPRAARPAARGGQIRIVVSIPQQRLYVFRGSELIETSPVSTGKRGHATPTGRFRVLQKRVEHYSSKYDNAPMPYMQRLTNYGIALHAGRLPGYPASHGCIRLPRNVARRLYQLTAHGTPVTITSRRPRNAREALSLA